MKHDLMNNVTKGVTRMNPRTDIIIVLENLRSFHRNNMGEITLRPRVLLAMNPIMKLF
jgi:hypothetical protein